jgi:tetratricopeptide (TPR) repeat protein
MSGKNHLPQFVIWLLFCVALSLIVLIVWDLRDQTADKRSRDFRERLPALQTVSPPASRSISSKSASNPNPFSPESFKSKTKRQGSELMASVSPVEGETRSHDPRRELYDKLPDLLNENRDKEAIQTLERIIRNDPKDLEAYSLLGELYYQNDQLPEAISAWEKILESNPLNEQIKAKFDKAQRENKTHEEFVHKATRHFRIKFEGSQNRDLYKTVLDVLEDAYSQVGKTLSFYPDQEIIVYLYTDRQFFDVTRVPSWTGGVFDGKIRIPGKGFQDDLSRLQRVLFHEYAHAAIHQMAEGDNPKLGRNNSSRVPTWLHEGIAQYLEPNDSPTDREETLKVWVSQGGFLELSKLHGSFMGFNSQVAGLAYAESLSAVKFLVSQYGPYSLQRILTALANERTIDEAIREATFISYDEFQSKWERYLKL